jgi:hypothetical protein
MLRAQLAMLRFPLEWELTRALCPGFFIEEIDPARLTKPATGADLHTAIGQPVALAGSAEFKTHDFLHPVLHPGLWLAWQTPST